MKPLVFSLVVLSVLPVLAGERVVLDNRVIVEGNRVVRGWTFNAVESYKPYGDVLSVMDNGSAGVRIASTGRPTQIYMTVPFPVKPGETFVLTARVRGEGSGWSGFFKAGSKWEWRGVAAERVAHKAADGDKIVSKRLTVPDDVARIRPMLASDSGTLEFFDLTLEKENVSAEKE